MHAFLSDVLARNFQVQPPVEPDATLEELGLDSLARAEFGAELQDSLRIEVGEDELASTTTVAQLAATLEAKGAAVPR
ncbi:acyl carrier protein [Kitasatospora sp. SolWspMP-SS2h]|uniref:acyl carrier protein n=1 Tax=Kitasatospora sp. SolWspMP-SS2h TaxID=1305729 RepID=UPI000DB92A83|nr:acyl carrier protein [Kitasatospora sp. SolWspMP-SS2h]RAJ31280.1 acyl carrier protein [Kitasatospora sp. SolWspMP-SS2h]